MAYEELILSIDTSKGQREDSILDCEDKQKSELKGGNAALAWKHDDPQVK